MAGCAAGVHVSKSQLVVCITGFVGFTILALGAVSDYWVTYGITATLSMPSTTNNSRTHTGPTSALLSREGLWRVCVDYVEYNSTAVTGQLCDFGISNPRTSSMSDGESSTRYEVGYLIGSWVLVGMGVLLSLVALVMSMAALRQKKNRSLMRGVATVFTISALVTFLGLIIFAVRTSKFEGEWPEGVSRYSSAVLSWSYAISWVGLLLCLIAGVGHLCIIRRYEDSML